jgi:hypothetical protein
MTLGWDAHIVFPQEVSRLPFVVAHTTLIAGPGLGSAKQEHDYKLAGRRIFSCR